MIIELIYSEEILDTAARVYWTRSVGRGYLVALALCVVSAVTLYTTGDRSFFLSVVIAIVILGSALAWLVYFVHRRRMNATFVRMGRPRAQMELGGTTLTVSSDAGSTTIPYAKFKEVWRYPSVWLLVLDNSQFITFPTQGIAEEAKNLLLSRFEKNGVKIA